MAYNDSNRGKGRPAGTRGGVKKYPADRNFGGADRNPGGTDRKPSAATGTARIKSRTMATKQTRAGNRTTATKRTRTESRTTATKRTRTGSRTAGTGITQTGNPMPQRATPAGIGSRARTGRRSMTESRRAIPLSSRRKRRKPPQPTRRKPTARTTIRPPDWSSGAVPCGNCFAPNAPWTSCWCIAASGKAPLSCWSPRRSSRASRSWR